MSAPSSPRGAQDPLRRERERSIYGEASNNDARELAEEGVEFARVPWVPRTDS